MQQMQAQIAAFQGQAQESLARAEKYRADITLEQYEAETDRIKALSTNLQPGDADDKEFEKRAKIAELYLKEQAINNQASRGVTNANTNGNAENLGSGQQQVRFPQQENRQFGATTPGQASGTPGQ
jgi:hypothetical protein